MEKTRKYFGTDGIRGKVGASLINPEFILKLGWAAGVVLGADSIRGKASHGHGGKVLIGKDTRISGYMLESALEAGLSAAGIDIHLLGPMPTPAIAYLTRTFRAKAGIVISASHNLYDDNGIKFFSTQGTKISNAIEKAIEVQLEQPMVTVDSANLGKAVRVVDASGRYIEFCKSTVPNNFSLAGIKIVVDCAHGATYHIASHVFRELGAKVITLATQPNGLNINRHCGSTHPEVVRKKLLEEEADVGIAFDGDGDRVIMVDHTGELVDGDELLFIMARSFKEKGSLSGGVVGTTMSNLGFEQAMKQLSIDFIRTNVGDRHVMHQLKQSGWTLGGESSGHIVNLALTTTGDGIISALQVLQVMGETGKSLYELKSGMTKCPQVLINVPAKQPYALVKTNAVQSAIVNVEKKLGVLGRVLLRASGTEPVVRVMVEGEDRTQINMLANDLAEIIKRQNICVDL